MSQEVSALQTSKPLEKWKTLQGARSSSRSEEQSRMIDEACGTLPLMQVRLKRSSDVRLLRNIFDLLRGMQRALCRLSVRRMMNFTRPRCRSGVDLTPHQQHSPPAPLNPPASLQTPGLR